MTKHYVLTKRFDRDLLPPGTDVYRAEIWDCGIAGDDSRTTGAEHISVSLKPDGSAPFFTIPVSLLKEI